MVSVRDGVLLFTIGSVLVLLMESADKVSFTYAISLIVLALVGFHLALFSVIAPHRLGIKKDDAYRLQPRRMRIGMPLLFVTADIGMGSGISVSLG